MVQELHRTIVEIERSTMAQSQIYVGLEIGTSKTCMVVGEVRPDATATIIGVGCVPSAGVLKGEIEKPQLARQCVRDALELAQNSANADIVNVYLSVTGEHIYGESNTGSYRLPEEETLVDEEFLARAREKAENLDLVPDRFVINRELGGYSIDGRPPTLFPEGLSGRTIDVNCHVIHGSRPRLQNSLRCVMDVPLEVSCMVFAPLATAMRVLKRSQKESGALVIDIGGGTTDYICYKGGEIVTCGCIPAGGRTINNDIIVVTGHGVSMEAAEALKCREGNAVGDTKDRSLALYRTDTGLRSVAIMRGELNQIIQDRLRDILERVKRRVPGELWRRNELEVYLSGGTSLMRGLDGLAGSVFGTRVQRWPMQPMGEERSYLNDPRYFTAIGLIRYAQKYEDETARATSWPSWLDWLRRVLLRGK